MQKKCYCYGNERTILRGLLVERRNHLHWASLKVVLDKISTLVSLNCRNFVAWSKRFICNRMGTMNSIMVLKDHFGFKFIHNSRFPRQTKEKVFVFKMSVNLPINGISLVNKMQIGQRGDFMDHVWLCEAPQWVDYNGMSYIWQHILQNTHNNLLHYVIRGCTCPYNLVGNFKCCDVQK